MTKCYVFDLDGTLADPTHRLWLVLKPDKDWRAFFAACGDDTLIEPVAELYNSLRHSTHASYTGYHMVILSGRSDECREATEAWLERYELYPEALYMRKAGDHRPDYMCKKDLLQQLLKDGYEPILFVDDRDQVVNMWRELGYTCLQCAPGGF
jgi:phosphoglycolate phosphatase-like HAD superfamily hydrolase